ncbi:MAG: hypothetical protein ACK476_15370 [Fluviicola sp.]
MKKIQLFTIALSISAINYSNAQGVLGKLKDKVGQTTSGGMLGAGESDYTGWPLPNEEQGKKDIENPKLEATTFATDQWGINGIYVSQKPFGAFHEMDKLDKTIQKFAVSISSDGKVITFSHSGHNQTLGALTALPLSEGGATEIIENSLLKKGIFFNRDVRFETSNSTTITFKDSTEYDGKIVSRGVQITSCQITMLEPGVFVVHPYTGPKNGITTCDGGSKFNGSEEELKYNPFNLIYKKGKDVSKWSDAAIIKELYRLSDYRCSLMLSENAASAEMPKKISGFKDEPKNADLLAAARARAKEYKWIETITAVYPTNSWSNIIEPKGNQGLETLTGRTMWIVAIMKTPKGECAIELIGITQENAYTVGTQQENYAGKPIFASSNGQLTPIDCTKTK